MAGDGGWCTIESDPGVFTELLTKVGAKGVQVAEVWELSKESLQALQPVYGLIFLFKWQQEEKKDDGQVAPEDAPEVFFAKQVISNACATQALLNVLMNRPEVQLGAELQNFKDFTGALDPEMRGLAIGNSDLIRQAHNSFGRPEPFMLESAPATEDDDVYHFIGYVHAHGHLWELDGLKSGPIKLAPCAETDWLDKVVGVVQERMNRYASKEIRFNLLALVKNRKAVFEEQLAELKAQQGSLSGDALQGSQAKQQELEQQIRAEEERFSRWAEENVRRQHNYVPFVFNLCKQLARRGKLDSLREAGAKAHEEALARRQAEKDKQKQGS